MDPSETVAAADAVLAIGGELNIYRAAELKSELLAALERGTSIDIDLSGVAEVDTAGLQLLLVALRTAAVRGKALRFLSPSDAVLEALELVNLRFLLGAVEPPKPGLS